MPDTIQTVLITEDDPAIQDALKIFLNRHGYKVLVSSDAYGVIDDKFEVPDIYLIDKQLPGIDGIELCKHLKAGSKTSHVPVIILSASPYVQTIAEEVGAEAFIEKPFRNKFLLDTISKLLQSAL